MKSEYCACTFGVPKLKKNVSNMFVSRGNPTFSELLRKSMII